MEQLYYGVSGVCDNMACQKGREHGYPQSCVQERCEHDWEHESRNVCIYSFVYCHRNGERSRAPGGYTSRIAGYINHWHQM